MKWYDNSYLISVYLNILPTEYYYMSITFIDFNMKPKWNITFDCRNFNFDECPGISETFMIDIPKSNAECLILKVKNNLLLTMISNINGKILDSQYLMKFDTADFTVYKLMRFYFTNATNMVNGTVFLLYETIFEYTHQVFLIKNALDAFDNGYQGQYFPIKYQLNNFALRFFDFTFNLDRIRLIGVFKENNQLSAYRYQSRLDTIKKDQFINRLLIQVDRKEDITPLSSVS